MPLFLITSVCDEGVSESGFKLVEADSRIAIAQDILKRPHDWEPFLRRLSFGGNSRTMSTNMGSLGDGALPNYSSRSIRPTLMETASTNSGSMK